MRQTKIVCDECGTTIGDNAVYIRLNFEIDGPVNDKREELHFEKAKCLKDYLSGKVIKKVEDKENG